MSQLVVSEELKEVLLRLTPDQARFVLKRATAKTDKEAAEKAGVSTHSVRSWRKTKPDFNLATRLVFAKPIEAALLRLERVAVEAIEVIADFLYHDKAHIRLNAATTLCKFIGLGTTRHLEVSGSVKVVPHISDEDLLNRARAVMERQELIVEGEIVDG